MSVTGKIIFDLPVIGIDVSWRCEKCVWNKIFFWGRWLL